MDLDRLVDTASPSYGDRDITDLVVAALPFFYFVAGAFVLYFFIMGGYEMMFSGGEPGKVASGKQKLTYSIIGFVIVFSAYWIVQIVAGILGIDRISNIF